jgi:hypothetical protein
MTLVLLWAGGLVFWFVYYAVKDHIADKKIERFLIEREGKEAFEHTRKSHTST